MTLDHSVAGSEDTAQYHAAGVRLGNGKVHLDAGIDLRHEYRYVRLRIGATWGESPAARKNMPIQATLSHGEAAKLAVRMLEIAFDYPICDSDNTPETKSDKGKKDSACQKIAELKAIVDLVESRLGVGNSHSEVVAQLN